MSIRANKPWCYMVKTGYLYLCNPDFVDGQINLVLQN